MFHIRNAKHGEGLFDLFNRWTARHIQLIPRLLGRLSKQVVARCDDRFDLATDTASRFAFGQLRYERPQGCTVHRIEHAANGFMLQLIRLKGIGQRPAGWQFQF